MDVDEDETVIPVPRSQSVEEDNPWMTVESDDEGLVIPGTKAPGSSKKAPKSKKKKLTEDRVAVDLEKVQKKLKEEENRRGGVSFNLTAAGDTSKAQRELIERAFAGDHVTEAEIATEKAEAVEAANEVEAEYKTLTMPGWGEWAGNGMKPSKRRQRILKEMEAKKKERSEELLAARRDAKLKHVVMTSKENKRFSMYQTSSIPAEFRDNAALYEASLIQPMGKEWTVRETHGALVKPKVVVRAGVAIEPIQKKQAGIQRSAPS
jgi:U3 small nucleolar RNA-associated protein 14